jgi:hypothetical protein
LRGKSFRTQYFGPSHGANLLLQFGTFCSVVHRPHRFAVQRRDTDPSTEELSWFVKDIIQRLPVLEKHRNMFKHHRHHRNVSQMRPEFASMVTLLPDRTRTDALVQEYFETIETTYRVLHAPTFFRRYKEFWATSQAEESSTFLVHLLLVCACVNCYAAGAAPGFIGRDTVGRDTATAWIEICEKWLGMRSQKHMTLDVFQVRVLLQIAKKLNCIKVKREWTASGQLLRQAMSAGFHREPTILSDAISPFDQEIRRRLWYTILELDLQSSLDRGTGAGLGPYDWDTLPPLNLHDEDFDETTDKMPPARPLTDFTRTSFLCLAQQHLPLRVDMLSRINSLRACITTDVAIELDQKIRQAQNASPKWNDANSNAMSKGLSELLLHQYVLLLHQPFTTQVDPQESNFYAKVSRRNAALSTMKIVTNLRPSSAKMLCCVRDDLYRACLASCHDLIVTINGAEDLLQDRALTVRLVEDSVNLMEDQIRGLGQGFHSYWLACSALGLMRSKLSTEPSEKAAQETANRVANLHGFMMASQVVPIEKEQDGEDRGDTNGLEDATMSTANALVGMSGQPAPAIPELDPFVTTSADPFNAFSESLFDFDFTDIWSIGGGPQY